MSFEAHPCETNAQAMVLLLSGRLGIAVAKEMGAAVTQAVEESNTGLIIDMSAVEFVGSGGLRELLMGYKKADASGKKIAMFGVSPEVYKIFKLTGFEGMFSIHKDEETAAKALQPVVSGKTFFDNVLLDRFMNKPDEVIGAILYGQIRT